MRKYGNKVPDMLYDMKMYHNSINDHSVSVVGDEVVYSPIQFARQIFISLATGSNGVFNNWLQRKKDEFYETGITDLDTLIRSAKMKYINMTDEWDRQDPQDAKQLALTTCLGNMETAKQSSTSGEGKTSSGATDEDNENIEGTTRVKKWRAVKKAASVTCDDKTWYWFPKHVLPGKFDVFYVTHKPENHVDPVPLCSCSRHRSY